MYAHEGKTPHVRIDTKTSKIHGFLLVASNGCAHTCIQIRTHIHIHTIKTQFRLGAEQSFERLSTYTYVCVCVRACVRACMCVCVCVCVYAYIHTYIHTYIQTNKHTHTYRTRTVRLGAARSLEWLRTRVSRNSSSRNNIGNGNGDGNGSSELRRRFLVPPRVLSSRDATKSVSDEDETH